MAKIIDIEQKRRIIRLSTDDVISVVQAYQTAAHKGTGIYEVRDCLRETVVYIPEDV